MASSSFSPGESSLPGVRVPPSRRALTWQKESEREINLPLSIQPEFCWVTAPLMTSFSLSCLRRTLSPDRVTLEVRVSTGAFWGHNSIPRRGGLPLYFWWLNWVLCVNGSKAFTQHLSTGESKTHARKEHGRREKASRSPWGLLSLGFSLRHWTRPFCFRDGGGREPGQTGDVRKVSIVWRTEELTQSLTRTGGEPCSSPKWTACPHRVQIGKRMPGVKISP